MIIWKTCPKCNNIYLRKFSMDYFGLRFLIYCPNCGYKEYYSNMSTTSVIAESANLTINYGTERINGH